jgi:hypothetical protein
MKGWRCVDDAERFVSIDIKLSEKHLPPSPVFLDFLHRHLCQVPHVCEWHNQLDETLLHKRREIEQNAKVAASTVLDDPLGKRAILHSYDLFLSLLTGKVARLQPYRERYHFICIVGCPRHGGSYLTKQLFKALGTQAERVPDVIAHDGFPDAQPFALRPVANTYTTMMHTMAEYLTMVDLFFSDSKRIEGHIVVPKKATKFAYHGAFFNHVLGPATEYIITLRHPVAACISTYEKSGGLPHDGTFKVRSKIEQWVRQGYASTDKKDKSIYERGYFEVYLRYWELYHCHLVLSGLPVNKNIKTVVFGEPQMARMADSFHERFGGNNDGERFQVSDKKSRHPQWCEQIEDTLNRVEGVWRGAGLDFPRKELLAGC